MVSRQDPRFTSLLPEAAGRRTLAELIARVSERGMDAGADAVDLASGVHACEARMAELGRLTIDQGVRDYIVALTGWGEARITSASMRIGLHPDGPATLEAAAVPMGVTRERARQLMVRLYGKRPDHPVLLPALEKAIAAVAAAGIIPVAEAAGLPMRLGLAWRPLPPESLLSIARFLGWDDLPEFLVVDGLLAGGVGGEVVKGVRQAVRRQIRAGGLLSFESLMLDLAAHDVNCSRDVVAEIVAMDSDLVELAEGWYASSGARESTVIRRIRKMLIAAPVQTLEAIAEGLESEHRFRVLSGSRSALSHDLPPRHVLAALLRSCDTFVLNDSNDVRATVPLRLEDEVTGTELQMVRMFWSSSTGLLTRAEIAAHSSALGLNADTVGSMLTYGCLFQRVAPEVWALRGAGYRAEDLRAVSERVIASRQQDCVGFSFLDGGRVNVRRRVRDRGGRPQSVSVAVPALRNRSYYAVDADGTPSGIVSIHSTGMSMGYTPFLKRMKAREGDILSVTFDAASDQVILDLERMTGLDG